MEPRAINLVYAINKGINRVFFNLRPKSRYLSEIGNDEKNAYTNHRY